MRAAHLLDFVYPYRFHATPLLPDPSAKTGEGHERRGSQQAMDARVYTRGCVLYRIVK